MMKLMERIMEMQDKSQVEKFYAAVAAKFGVEKPFSELSPMEQIQLVQGINLILQVIRD